MKRLAPDGPPSPAMRWMLATLSLGAGAIHLVMVPQHAQESLRVGLVFAAAGWFQIAFGAAMVSHPKRIWVQLAVVANVAFVAAWVLSRTAGLPVWTGDGGVESASSVDITCVVFEVGLVVGAVALLVAPNLLKGWGQSALVLASVIPVGILVATTAVLASPSTANHVHGGADDPTHLAAGDAHSHETTAAGAPAADHTHAESDITYDQLPPATKAEVDQVSAVWAHKYPTAADAMKDGWFRGSRSLYGIGAHYVKGATSLSIAAPFDMMNPNILLFDGDGPDAKFAGLSYVVSGDVEGFTGPYDVWHTHTSVCVYGSGIVSLSEENSPVWLSESECTAKGGRVMALATDKMMHLWIGPGYTDAPVFAHDNPKLLTAFNPKRDAWN